MSPNKVNSVNKVNCVMSNCFVQNMVEYLPFFGIGIK